MESSQFYMWISLCLNGLIATFEWSKPNKRFDCSNDYVRFHPWFLLCSHSQIVNLSIVNRALVILNNMHGVSTYLQFLRIFSIDFNSNDLISKGIQEGMRKCNRCVYLSVFLIRLQRLNDLSSTNDSIVPTIPFAFTPDFTCGMCIWLLRIVPYDYSASFKTDAKIVITHSVIVNLSIVNRALIILNKTGS